MPAIQVEGLCKTFMSKRKAAGLRGVCNLLVGGAVAWLSVGAPPDPRGWPLLL